MSLAFDLVIRPGARYEYQFTWSEGGVPVDMSTGWEARAQVRDANNNLIFDMSDSNGQLVLGTGSVTVLLPAAATSGKDYSRAFWDLLVKNADGEIQPPLVEGRSWTESLVTQWT